MAVIKLQTKAVWMKPAAQPSECSLYFLQLEMTPGIVCSSLNPWLRWLKGLKTMLLWRTLDLAAVRPLYWYDFLSTHSSVYGCKSREFIDNWTTRPCECACVVGPLRHTAVCQAVCQAVYVSGFLVLQQTFFLPLTRFEARLGTRLCSVFSSAISHFFHVTIF